MKNIDKLEDLGVELELNDDVMVVVTKDNCPISQMLFIRLQTMEAEGEIETPIVVHNMDKSESFESSKSLYDIDATPTVIRYHKGSEYGRAENNMDKLSDEELESGKVDLTPKKFKELDLMKTIEEEEE